MSGVGGKDFVLQVEDSAGAGTYTTIAGLRAKTFAKAAEAIDATSHGSNQNREIVDGAGIKSLNVSGSGIMDTDKTTIQRIEDAHDNQTLTNFRLVDSSSGGRTYTASFKITSLEVTGEYNGALEFSISLESSGAVTIS